jgi:hypothetical protein
MNLQVYNHNMQLEACQRGQQSKQSAPTAKVNVPRERAATGKTSPAAPSPDRTNREFTGFGTTQPQSAQPTTNADRNDSGRGVAVRSEPDFNALKVQQGANTAKVKTQIDADKAKSDADSVFPSVSPETGKRIYDWQQKQSEDEKKKDAWRANPKAPKVSPANPIER